MDDLDLLKKNWQKLDNFSQVSEQEIYGIVEMILDSIIGEERRIEKIKYIEITKEFNSDIINKRTPLINLEKHLNHLS